MSQRGKILSTSGVEVDLDDFVGVFIARFIETPGAGVYTATIDLPTDSFFAGFRISSDGWEADTAQLRLLDGDGEQYSTYVYDVKAPHHLSQGWGRYNEPPAGDRIVAELTTTGEGGSSGVLFVVFHWFTRDSSNFVEAVKA